MHNSEKYDGLATEELEKILRSNMENTADLKTDEELLSISEILVLRKQDSDCPGKTAKEGWKSFRKNYSPYKPAKLTPRARR